MRWPCTGRWRPDAGFAGASRSPAGETFAQEGDDSARACTRHSCMHATRASRAALDRLGPAAARAGDRRARVRGARPRRPGARSGVRRRRLPSPRDARSTCSRASPGGKRARRHACPCGRAALTVELLDEDFDVDDADDLARLEDLLATTNARGDARHHRRAARSSRTSPTGSESRTREAKPSAERSEREWGPVGLSPNRARDACPSFQSEPTTTSGSVELHGVDEADAAPPRRDMISEFTRMPWPKKRTQCPSACCVVGDARGGEQDLPVPARGRACVDALRVGDAHGAHALFLSVLGRHEARLHGAVQAAQRGGGDDPRARRRCP